ncbi:MAG: DUF3179 domain-containing protein [Bacillota bacterium]|nr:DUF3179 domain-containing protein [Bacillota bacterium]MDW7682601.1 DUF3179 domain-containing protein [Bacillota bacterium]
MAIDIPVFLKGNQALLQMRDNERVVGVEINGEARAYPLNILSVHEIINDTVGGEPIAVTWCPLSYSAVIYRRAIIDRALSFGISGGILRNTMVMYDRQTDSYWNQLTGTAFSGPLSGHTLRAVPSVLTSWAAWHSLYPASMTLSKAGSPYRHYEDDHMSDYYCSNKTGIRQPARKDDRLPAKELIMGIPTTGSVAYPFSLLRESQLIHDNAGENSVVVFFDRASDTARAYSAVSDGFALSFYEQNGKFFDYQTTSLWSPLSGRAVKGPLRNRGLMPLTGITAFWFAWADHYPETNVYKLPAIN